MHGPSLLLEETPQGGFSCRFAAIHLQGDRVAVDEVVEYKRSNKLVII